jgi:putative PIN family toxin of toxin-antitoxin system
MPSVVLDASTLVGALLKADSVPEKALMLARARATICMSASVAAEIAEVFARPRFADALPSSRVTLVLEIVMGAARWYHPKQAVSDCRDAKDNKYLELALEAQAEIIVSSDQDLFSLNPWRGIAIIAPAEFLARLG